MRSLKNTSAVGELQPVERRLHQYPGCKGLVYRWFIVGDVTPYPFRSFEEAMDAWVYRQDRRERAS
jgi:hypothetical protein